MVLGKGDEFFAYFQMALGMAEYRCGHYEEAERVLRAASEARPSDPYLPVTSAFYRAMSLFRQGKPNEARALATEAASRMRPLPQDAGNPLAGGGVTHDELIVWMAYKEARASFNLTIAAESAAWKVRAQVFHAMGRPALQIVARSSGPFLPFHLKQNMNTDHSLVRPPAH